MLIYLENISLETRLATVDVKRFMQGSNPCLWQNHIVYGLYELDLLRLRANDQRGGLAYKSVLSLIQGSTP